jgi:hypothetical protein
MTRLPNLGGRCVDGSAARDSPSGATTSVAAAALLKAVKVFSLPSVDPFTAIALLRTMPTSPPICHRLRSDPMSE